MAVKPENQFIAKVHKHLPASVYREKTANPFRGGTPDVYYEGQTDTLFVEYKFAPQLTPIIELSNTRKQPHLTKLQQLWIRRAVQNGRAVSVILGTPEGGVVFDGDTWNQTYTRNDLHLQSHEDIARWLTQKVT